MPEDQATEEIANANAPEGASAKLFSDLKSTPAKRLTRSVERVDGLTPEEEEALERGGKFALRGTVRKIQRWAYHTVFVAGVVLTIGFVLAIFAIVAIYIAKINSEGKIEFVMSSILTFLAGVAVTLATEKFTKRDK